ncbi:UNVERIFIED_CONTAM: hypothetical protein GTU68_002085 [Idotea baltica]|nr:hypothetical protein [Idotea baltica]
MTTALPFSIYYESGDGIPIFKAASITLSVGALLWFLGQGGRSRVSKREGYLIVAMSWLGMTMFSSLPYILSGYFPSITDALFESVSGLTTTGATILTDIESTPQGLLFWRSMTQWIGGMGIIVLTVAVFPLLGIGGVELFVAEAPGPTSDKIHPRIKETAKRLWLIYVSLTALLCVLLCMTEMNFFDAVNHALTTMATGGFSTKNNSVAHFGSTVQYIIMFFMFMAGVNYTVLYFGFKGRFKRVWRSDEFKTYLYVLSTLFVLVTIAIYWGSEIGLEDAFRQAAFQIVSIITTTGYITADYTNWGGHITILFFCLLFVGACAGSTSGGIKLIRHLVFFKSSMLEFKRLLHPNALIRVKIDKKLVAPRVLIHILVFLLLYLSLFVLGSIVMVYILRDFDHPMLSGLSAVATALGNVGPGIAELGPMDNFSTVPLVGKWVLALFMLLGRLELFTILILFLPYFWRDR